MKPKLRCLPTEYHSMVASQQNQRTPVSHSQQLVKPKRPLGCGLRDAMPVAVDAKPAHGQQDYVIRAV